MRCNFLSFFSITARELIKFMHPAPHSTFYKLHTIFYNQNLLKRHLMENNTLWCIVYFVYYFLSNKITPKISGGSWSCLILAVRPNDLILFDDFILILMKKKVFKIYVFNEYSLRGWQCGLAVEQAWFQSRSRHLCPSPAPTLILA